MELFVGLLLYHHVSLMGKLFGVISARIFKPGPGIKTEEIGASISSFQTLMNHSCDANTHVLKCKERQLILSLRPIKAGEQVRYANLELEKCLH